MRLHSNVLVASYTVHPHVPQKPISMRTALRTGLLTASLHAPNVGLRMFHFGSYRSAYRLSTDSTCLVQALPVYQRKSRRGLNVQIIAQPRTYEIKATVRCLVLGCMVCQTFLKY